jgi:radical SAM protein with 4Fe4S-binding SPASM domain
MDRFGIDSHKLMYHPARVAAWLEGHETYPIYVEVSLSGACNHRCSFCALDFIEHAKVFLDTDMICKELFAMSKWGVKSVMFGGEGEPLIHPRFTDILAYAGTKTPLDIALTTNGSLLTKRVVEYMCYLKWIKISVDAGTKETYAKLHGIDHFDLVIKTIKRAVKVRDKYGLDCAIGMQMVWLPENRKEVQLLAEIGKEIGVDYLVIKPHSQHLKSKSTTYRNIDYSQWYDDVKGLDDFQIIFRHTTFSRRTNGRGYGGCNALPFWSYIDSKGNVWGCSAHISDERFLYGNLYENSFHDIWAVDKRKECQKEMLESIPDDCRLNCRMDLANKYLWDLKNPKEHVNFI